MDSDPLSALRDIHTPPVPEGLSVWPVVAGIAAFVILAALVLWLVLRAKQRWAADLKQDLSRLGASEPQIALAEAAALLRRAALARFGAAATKAQGDTWLAMLDRLFRTSFFSSGDGRIFGASLYEPVQPKTSVGEILADLKRLASRREWLPW